MSFIICDFELKFGLALSLKKTRQKYTYISNKTPLLIKIDKFFF